MPSTGGGGTEGERALPEQRTPTRGATRLSTFDENMGSEKEAEVYSRVRAMQHEQHNLLSQVASLVALLLPADGANTVDMQSAGDAAVAFAVAGTQ